MVPRWAGGVRGTAGVVPRRVGARVVASELVGLIPAAALAGVDPADLLLPGDTPDRFLETRLARALDTHAEVS